MSGAGELHELDPVRGLPEYLPEGEDILWQGQPRWWSLCRRAFHIDLLFAYFIGLVIWSLLAPGEEQGAALWLGIAVTLGLGALAATTFMLLALLICRTTIYTITNQRVVMQFGVALPINLNLPFSRVQAAAYHQSRDGTGDITLHMTDDNRVAYLLLWPHVRPWRVRQPQPMLRSLPDAATTADLLASALKDFHGNDEEAAGSSAEMERAGPPPALKPTADQSFESP